jgi:hypothetical protein
VARGRFVVRHQGDGEPPAEDVARILGLAGTNLVAQSAGPMMLVESDEEPLRALVGSLPGWVVSPEQMIAIPDTRRRVRRPPDGTGGEPPGPR